jgi:hypothetical protein
MRAADGGTGATLVTIGDRGALSDSVRNRWRGLLKGIFVKISSKSCIVRPMNALGPLRIGELSRRAGVSPELLRAWERRYGLLRPTTRTPGGLRWPR